MSRRQTSTVTSYQTALDHLAGGRNKNDRPAPAHSSTRIVRDMVEPNSVSVIYHQTPIVTYRVDGTILLYAAGWATKTTALAMETYVPGLRVQVRRYAAHVDSKVAERAVKRGELTIGQDRHGRGDALTLQYHGRTHLMDARDAVRFVLWAPDFSEWRTPDATYDCRCVMCQGGYDTWQQAAYAGAWS